jgi:putative membrane-bound dehydrogenase-like protein
VIVPRHVKSHLRLCEERSDEATSSSRSLRLFAICAFLLVRALPGFSAETPNPNTILSTFEIHPDFQIELAASEPQVFSPVDVEFDERGRPFVMEMLGYPFPNDPGRIVVLDDKDGDGVYETRTVFADGFAMANSLLPYNGGLLVISPPDILFLKDTNGDDVADVREVVMTGLAVANPEDSVNGLSYGLDNWIYAANGGNSGTLRWPDGGEPLELRADDFRFHLGYWQYYERTGRSAQGFEMSFDPWGRPFTANHTGPLYHRVFPGRYIEWLPEPRGGTLKALPDDVENGLVRIYPIGEQATRLNHPEQSGYFSGACSPKFYGGGAFGPGFDNSIFVCDVVLNLVHRRILEPAGTSFIARRDDRPKAEFLASTDRAFRPVNLTVAPDGSLWVVDMHRVVIEHPEWIPEELQKNLDLNAGKNQGRLFRIVPKSGLPRVKPDFRRDNIEGAVAALENPNQWWRTTAQRLLVQWADRDSVPLLEKLLQSKNPLARAHALWTLQGLGALRLNEVISGLDDPDAGVREQALQLAAPGEFTRDFNSDRELCAALVGRTLTQISHPLPIETSKRVRMWLALALSQYMVVDNDDLAARQAGFDNIVRIDAGDPYLDLAMLPGLMMHPAANLYAMLSRARATRPPAEADSTRLLESLAQAGVNRLDRAQRIQLMTATAEPGLNEDTVVAVLRGFAVGIESMTGGAAVPDDWMRMSDALAPLFKLKSLPALRQAWRLARALHLQRVPGQDEALRHAETVVRDPSSAPDARVQNLQILEFAPFTQRAELLYAMLDTRRPRELQREAIQQLQREGTYDVAERLIAMWRQLGPNTRPAAGDTLLYKRANNGLLLTALETSTISLGEMDFHLERRRVLLHSKDPEIVRRAEALFSDAGVVTRKDAIEKMKPALKLDGNPAHGKEIFTNLCAKCHRMGNDGGDIGPNLTEIYRKSRETLMHDILDPNAAADTKYIAYTIERKNGEIVSGLIAEETDAAVTLRDANGVGTVVTRGDIKEMISGGLSLMPEELESGLDAQAMADLLAYLQERK